MPLQADGDKTSTLQASSTTTPCTRNNPISLAVGRDVAGTPGLRERIQPKVSAVAPAGAEHRPGAAEG